MKGHADKKGKKRQKERERRKRETQRDGGWQRETDKLRRASGGRSRERGRKERARGKGEKVGGVNRLSQGFLLACNMETLCTVKQCYMNFCQARKKNGVLEHT